MSKNSRMDNPALRFLNQIADIMILSLLWLIGCLPVITIGTATTALYYASMQAARGEGTAVRNFLRACRQNWKQAALVELILLGLGLVLYVDVRAALGMEGLMRTVLLPLLVVVLVLFAMAAFYLFPLLARFDCAIPVLFRNAALISFTNLPCTLAVIGLHLMAALLPVLLPELLVYGFPAFLALLPGGLARACAALFARVFRKYAPDRQAKAEGRRAA